MANAHLASSQDHADRIHQLEAELQDFSHIVSHDLMTSFRHINAFIGILADDLDGELTDPQQQNFERVRTAAGQCHAMLDQLLIYSRAQQRRLEFSSCKAACLVDAARLQLSLAIRETGADFIVGDLGEIYVDQELMTHALTRIFDNTLTHTVTDRTPRIEIWREPDPVDWVARVSDNGPGLPPGDPERLFRMFYRGQPRNGPDGVGAGLAICRRIFRRHGGDVAFVPQDEGACLELRLPMDGRAERGVEA